MGCQLVTLINWHQPEGVLLLLHSFQLGHYYRRLETYLLHTSYIPFISVFYMYYTYIDNLEKTRCTPPPGSRAPDQSSDVSCCCCRQSPKTKILD